MSRWLEATTTEARERNKKAPAHLPALLRCSVTTYSETPSSSFQSEDCSESCDTYASFAGQAYAAEHHDTYGPASGLDRLVQTDKALQQLQPRQAPSMPRVAAWAAAVPQPPPWTRYHSLAPLATAFPLAPSGTTPQTIDESYEETPIAPRHIASFAFELPPQREHAKPIPLRFTSLPLKAFPEPSPAFSLTTFESDAPRSQFGADDREEQDAETNFGSHTLSQAPNEGSDGVFESGVEVIEIRSSDDGSQDTTPEIPHILRNVGAMPDRSELSVVAIYETSTVLGPGPSLPAQGSHPDNRYASRREERRAERRRQDQQVALLHSYRAREDNNEMKMPVHLPSPCDNDVRQEQVTCDEGVQVPIILASPISATSMEEEERERARDRKKREKRIRLWLASLELGPMTGPTTALSASHDVH